MSFENRLSSAIELLEKCIWNSSISNEEDAKKSGTECIKVLNSTRIESLTSEQKWQLAAVSNFILENFRNKQFKLTATEKVLWICSKLVYSPTKVEYYFPIITFNDKLTSGQFSPIVQEDDLRLPANAEATFRSFVFEDWSTNGIHELCQDLVDNCSFVSAMLSLAKIDPSYFLTLVHPNHNSENYTICLYFNGTIRRVNVKNSFPQVSDRARNLTVKSNSNENLHWPAIIEKAYLIVLGGDYDTSGSNLALDVFMLNKNWIPEVLPIKYDTKQLTKLAPLFHQKGVLLGLGTGKMSEALSKKSGLISQHDYVIEDINDKISLRNTWASETSLREVSISMEDLTFFSYLYINWDISKMFRYTANTIRVFRTPQIKQIHHLPQYSLCNPNSVSEEVWILLECHIPSPEFNVTSEIYETDIGEQVMMPNQYNCAFKNTSNSQVTLLKFNMLPKASYTMVLHFNQTVNVSMHLYNNISSQFNFKKAQPKRPLRFLESSLWSTHKIADGVEGARGGGNWSMPTYIYNPQFDLVVEKDTRVDLALYSEHGIYVNIDVFHSDSSDTGSSIRLFDPSKLIFQDKYSHECQVQSLLLLSGTYKVVISNYQNTAGNYFFHVFANAEITVKQIIPLLGIFLRRLVLQWNQSNRIKIYFDVESYNSKMTIHLSATDSNSSSAYRPSIRGSIFDSKTLLGILLNEEWCDLPYGNFIDITLESPGRYVLLVERFEQGSGSCMIQIGCSNQFTVVGW